MILIQSISQDNSTDDVLDWIYYLSPSTTVVRLNNVHQITNIAYNISNDNEHLRLSTDKAVVDTKEVSRFWYRRGEFSFNNFVSNSVHRRVGWQAQNYLENELQHILSHINDSFKSDFNGINKAEDNDTNKLSNLKLAKKAGLSIPDTLICCDVSTLTDFIKKHKRVISKSINSSFYQQKINSSCYLVVTGENKLLTLDNFEETCQSLASETFLPSQFQQYIDKKFELRIFYLLGQLYTMAIFSQENEKTKIDFRNYDYSRPNRCVPFILPDSIERKISIFMESAELSCGSIDMIYTTSGKYIFLEVNPIGQFQWLDRGCNYFLAKAIATHLITK